MAHESDGYVRYLGTSVRERRPAMSSLGWRKRVASRCIPALLIVIVAALPAGCADQLKQNMSLQCAIKYGWIKGVTPRDIPWEEVVETDVADAGEFSEVDIVNIHLAKPDYTTPGWSVVFGRSRVDGKWKLVRVAQYKGPDLWESLPILPGGDVASTEESSGGRLFAKLDLLKAAIQEGRIPAVKTEDREKTIVHWRWPEVHKGEFSDVDIRNLDIHKSDGTMERWAIVFGELRSNDWWKVIRVARRANDKEWENILAPKPRVIEE